MANENENRGPELVLVVLEDGRKYYQAPPPAIDPDGSDEPTVIIQEYSISMRLKDGHRITGTKLG